MHTAKTIDGQLILTEYLPIIQDDEESGERMVIEPEVPEGEVRVTRPTDDISLHFFECWELVNGEIVVSLAKAKIQRTTFIRTLIDEKLLAIDGKSARATRDAILTGNHTYVQQYESAAAALRSLRSNTGVDSLTTLLEVAAYLPEELA